MLSPGGKGVDHILLCPPERASLAPPPPVTFLAFSEGGERMVNQEDSFDLDKLLKSQKTLGFFNIWLN